MPLDELHDQEVGLDCLWGRLADELRERELAAPTSAAKCAAAEHYLLARTVRALERHPAVRFALRQLCGPGGQSVAAIADQTGLTARRLIEVFRREIGMPPKVFARVRRFQRAVQAIGGSGQAIDWADVAIGCGYYDQAHFIHDFRNFAGLTPSAYLRARTEHLNHVPFESECIRNTP
jgi:AraC-like DNA-binding protein